MSAAALALGIAIQLVALHRALSVQDDKVEHYNRTVELFFYGVIVVAVALLVSMLVIAEWESLAPSSQ